MKAESAKSSADSRRIGCGLGGALRNAKSSATAAELTGFLPSAITLIGVQYADIETWGGGLSPAVAAALAPAVAAGYRELALWEEMPHVAPNRCL